jgi:hypothetical protein
MLKRLYAFEKKPAYVFWLFVYLFAAFTRVVRDVFRPNALPSRRAGWAENACPARTLYFKKRERVEACFLGAIYTAAADRIKLVR